VADTQAQSGLNKELYSIREAGEKLSLSRSTVYALMNDRRLPAVKIGRKTLIPATGIAKFLASLPPAPFIDSEAA
jgi:excisionase family DNA binding protein